MQHILKQQQQQQQKNEIRGTVEAIGASANVSHTHTHIRTHSYVDDAFDLAVGTHASLSLPSFVLMLVRTKAGMGRKGCNMRGWLLR